METVELGNTSQIWLKGFAALMRRFFTEDTNGMQQSSVSRVVMKHFYLSLRCFVCDFIFFFSNLRWLAIYLHHSQVIQVRMPQF